MKSEYQVSRDQTKHLLEYEFYAIPDKHREIFIEMGIADLIAIIDENTHRNGKWVEPSIGKKYYEDTYELDDSELVAYAKYELLQRLNLVEWSDLKDLLYEYHIKKLEEKVKQLEKEFKNHRHQGAFNLYTEKPAW